MKICLKCKELKPQISFAKSAGRKDGLNPYCKCCTKVWREQNREKLLESKKEHYRKNIEVIKEKSKKKYMDNKDKYINSMRSYYSIPDNYKKRILQHAKRNAKLCNVPYDLCIEDIEIPEYCPVLGEKLTTILGKGNQFFNASIDRIIPKKGYIKGNVQIISRKANTMKSNATPLELLKFAEWVLENQKAIKELDNV